MVPAGVALSGLKLFMRHRRIAPQVAEKDQRYLFLTLKRGVGDRDSRGIVCPRLFLDTRMNFISSRPRILILCSGNSARSQMAEGLWHYFGEGEFDVNSAGTKPSELRPEAVIVMGEIGIDISHQHSKSIGEFAGETFDIVLTVCDDAWESCPTFPGTEQIHWSIDDPAATHGSDAARLNAFRRVRDELRRRIATELALREPV